MWLFWRFLFYTFFLLMCAAYLLASTAVEVLSNPFPRDQLSSAFYSTLATFSRWMVNRCVLLTCAFTKITRSRVHDVLSNSQRLLRQARTPHRSINPVTASYGYLLNPQPVISGQDALGLITIYPRPDEHWNPPQLPATASRSHSIQPPFHRSRRAAALKTIFYPSLILP